MWYRWPYTDLHNLNLDWILSELKMWQARWEQLPDYIKEQIEQYLSDANLAEIVQTVLQEYGFVINVKVPGNNLTPAVGDGSTDDTAAIQAMIAYGSTHGMPLLFPAGTYRVSGLNVNVDTVLMGSASTLMLMNVSSAPLISVSAKFECFGMTLNGNIGGQTTPQNVINCTSGRFMIDHCHISSGLSGITGNVTGECRLVDSEISNFSEYGLYLEGSGHIVSSAVTIPNVASGGALRFIRLDVSNSYVIAWSSLAEVSTGIELTGDNNYLKANFPNVETPVNDDGQNNNWEITGKSEKCYFNGSAYHSYQNLQENVEGDLTQNVGDFDGTASGHYSFSGEDVILNPTNPLTYKTPSALNDFFKTIPAKDKNGDNYDILVKGSGLERLSAGIKIVDVTNPPVGLTPVHGDGKTDDIDIIEPIIEYCQSNGCILFIPCVCALSRTLEISNPITIMGLGSDATNLDQSGDIFQHIKSGFRAISANSGAVIRLIGNNGGYRFVGFSIDGNNLAQQGLRLDRQRNSLFENIEIASTLDAALFIVPAVGIYNNDNFMFNAFINIVMSKVGKGIYAAGNLDTGNLCHNLFANFSIAYNGGWAILLDDSDNNTFIGIYTFRYPDATSEQDVLLEENSRSNVFIHLQGTVRATGGSRNSIYHYDRENGQAEPIADATEGHGSLFWTEMGNNSEAWQLTNPMRNLIADITTDAVVSAQYNGYDNGAFQIRRGGSFTKVGIANDITGTTTVYSSNGDKIDGIAEYTNQGFTYQKWGNKIYRIADRAPIAGEGNHNIGDIVFNNMSTSQQYIGWVCTTAGNPGTWKGFGEVSNP